MSIKDKVIRPRDTDGNPTEPVILVADVIEIAEQAFAEGAAVWAQENPRSLDVEFEDSEISAELRAIEQEEGQ